MNEPLKEVLFPLFESLINDTLTAEQQAQLQSLLGENLAARSLYIEYMEVETALRRANKACPEMTESTVAWLEDATTGEASVSAASRDRHLRRPSPAAWFGGLVRDFAQQPLLLVALIVGLASVGVLAWKFSTQPAMIAQNPATPPLAKGAPDATSRPQSPAVVPRVARLVRTEGAKWAKVSSPAVVGPHPLPIDFGDRLVLEQGLAEIAFDTGAMVILEGPAELVVGGASSQAKPATPGNHPLPEEEQNDPVHNSAYLAAGKLVARVPKQAHGFTVSTPSARFVDLGTEFAVQVTPPAHPGNPPTAPASRTGSTEIQVFEGRVAVHDLPPVAAGGERPALPAEVQPDGSLILNAREALVFDERSNTVQRRAAEPARFVRAMPEPNRAPYPFHNTGVGLARGAADPYWQVTAVSTDPNFKAQQAVVVAPFENFTGASPNTAQCVSLADPNPELPAECRMTFRTTFDLTGFDPNTATLQANIKVNFNVAELRLNGVPQPVPLRAPRGQEPGSENHRMPAQLNGSFTAGVNTLEIVIENRKNKKSAMALFVDWKGTARRLAKNIEENR